jgi:hypothetical protein
MRLFANELDKAKKIKGSKEVKLVIERCTGLNQKWLMTIPGTTPLDSDVSFVSTCM